MNLPKHESTGFPKRALARGPASLSQLLMGCRLYALAVAASAGALLPGDRADRPLLVAGILVSVGLALVQHAAVVSGIRRSAVWLSLPQLIAWTLLIRATGGQGSPLVVGYMLELPLSGALLSRRGVAETAVAATLVYLVYASTIDGPIQHVTAATVVGSLAVCAAITWHVVGVVERQRARLEAASGVLAREAESLTEELRLLGNNMPGVLVGIDGSGRIASLNPSAAAFLEIDAGTALGRPWQEVLSADPASRSRLLQTLASGTPQRGVTMVLDLASGRSATALAEIWLSPAAGGRRTYLLLDSTLPATAEDPVRRLGEAAACVAHQIKNSIHALQGFVRHFDNAKLGVRAGGVESTDYTTALAGLGELAEDVLAMAGSSRPSQELVVIRDALRSASVLLPQVPLTIHLPEVPLCVRASRSQLVHALFNLLDNAMQASPPGRPVEVRAEASGDWVAVEIVDFGPGLPPEVANATGPVPSRVGTGLGLAAARRFVESSGGRLTITSGKGLGTRCRLELPAAVRPCVA